MGIKPVYYFLDDKRIVFASEIKAIFQIPSINISMNSSAFFDYLMYQYGFGDDTFFKGIKKLLPGHYLSVKDHHYSLAKYWDLPTEGLHINGDNGIRELQCQVKELLRDAVRLRLRSDVDVGCYLSGGVDSSAITCLAAELSKRQIKTFTGNSRKVLNSMRPITQKSSLPTHEQIIMNLMLNLLTS